MQEISNQNEPLASIFKSCNSMLLAISISIFAGQVAHARRSISQPTTTSTPSVTSTTSVTSISVTKVSSALSLSSAYAEQIQTASVSVKSASNLSGLIVDIRIYNSLNEMIVRKNFDNVSLAAGIAVPFQFSYQVPSTLAVGNYTAVVAVFSSLWATYLWDSIGAFSIVAAPVVPPPVSSLLGVNPGFESGMTTYDNWGNALAVSGQARSGNLSLQVGTSAGGMGRDIMALVTAGSSYELAAYAKTSNPADYAEISVVFKNASNVLIFNKAIKVDSTSYALYKIPFTVPADAVSGFLAVWKNAGSSYLYVDDFSLVATSTPPGPAGPDTTTTSTGQGYPFGSRKTPYVAGIRPNNVSQAAQDTAVISLYNSWKSTLVAGCGGYYVKFRAPYAAVSEGIGYGMLITVVMAGYDTNARTYFDGLFKFARAHPAYNVDPNLLDWRVNGDCTSAGDGWNALDGDLDIAMGLLMADRQWGSSGTINYKAEAIKTINAMKAKNFNSAGYSMGGPAPDLSRTSDYMITHFRAFKRVTGDGFWDTAINKSFELMSLMQSRFAPNTGLIPDFIVGLPANPAPSPGGRIESDTEGFYAWNACRIPWRLGSDYVTSGDIRSKEVAGKLMDFLNSKTGGDAIQIQMGYKLDGTPLSNIAEYSSPSFSGPAVAGALIDGRFQLFLNSLWTLNSSKPAVGYYDYELQLISMMVASGNWWNP